VRGAGAPRGGGRAGRPRRARGRPPRPAGAPRTRPCSPSWRPRAARPTPPPPTPAPRAPRWPCCMQRALPGALIRVCCRTLKSAGFRSAAARRARRRRPHARAAVRPGARPAAVRPGCRGARRACGAPPGQAQRPLRSARMRARSSRPRHSRRACCGGPRMGVLTTGSGSRRRGRGRCVCRERVRAGLQPAEEDPAILHLTLRNTARSAAGPAALQRAMAWGPSGRDPMRAAPWATRRARAQGGWRACVRAARHTCCCPRARRGGGRPRPAASSCRSTRPAGRCEEPAAEVPRGRAAPALGGAEHTAPCSAFVTTAVTVQACAGAWFAHSC